MRTPKLGTKPMVVTFENDEEFKDFVKYAENHQKTNSETMNRVRREFREVRAMRRRRGR
ncbi:hypothetical protein QUF84_20995 [Fictibacillus enclensis]|uniref:hypothetical protein n=1 Tax=Fictibacillus enclensis TaxID=1017270 RepID=UPI0025A0198F|nr:hypothetical protein [Fictibacillus enclensis]MDM5339680.1 hypothetical protein [Fictibacillus enclensis]